MVFRSNNPSRSYSSNRPRSSWYCLLLLLLLTLRGVGSASLTTEQGQELLQEAQRESLWIQDVRRTLHKYPELSYEERQTSAYIRQRLRELDIPFTHPVAKHGITATIGQGTPHFALRADMDALPIQEEVEVEYRSQNPSKMHACGHDGHMAMLLGAAKLLKRREAELKGTVVLLFQPAEEGRGGAADMIAEGALKDVIGISGIHVWPGLPSGTIYYKTGTIMAASDRFLVSVHGRGGHGAMPHLTADPVLAAAMIIVALQPLISRETSPTNGAVITVSRINTGQGAFNVIPETVELGGTMRALTHERFIALRQRVTEVITTTAGMCGCNATIEWSARPYPPTVNDAFMAALAAVVAGKLGNAEQLEEPTMAAEDFSFFAEQVPGHFAFLGIRNETAGSLHGLHTPQFQLDETQLPLGAAFHAGMALEALSAWHAGQQDHSSSPPEASAATGREEL